MAPFRPLRLKVASIPLCSYFTELDIPFLLDSLRPKNWIYHSCSPQDATRITLLLEEKVSRLHGSCSGFDLCNTPCWHSNLESLDSRFVLGIMKEELARSILVDPSSKSLSPFPIRKQISCRLSMHNNQLELYSTHSIEDPNASTSKQLFSLTREHSIILKTPLSIGKLLAHLEEASS
jgi:hypothetical protein